MGQSEVGGCGLVAWHRVQLAIAVVAIGLLAWIAWERDRPGQLATPWAWIALGTGVVTTICVATRRHASVAATAVPLTVALLVPLAARSPIEVTGGNRNGLDLALLGAGTPSVVRVTAGLLCGLLAVAAVVRIRLATKAPRWSRWAIAVGVIAALAFPIADALGTWTRDRISDPVADSEVVADPAPDASVRSGPVGAVDGWTRADIGPAVVAGDVVYAIEERVVDVVVAEAVTGDGEVEEIVEQRLVRNSVVGLRASDGALLWRYRVEGARDQSTIDSITVDPISGTTLVRVGAASVGLRPDGRVAYTTRMPDDRTEQAARVASVRLFRSDGSRNGDDVLTLVDVATGDVVWEQVQPDAERCAVETTEPNPNPTRTAFIFSYGTDCEPTLTRITGSTVDWTRTLSLPDAPSSTELLLGTSDAVAAVTDDGVLVFGGWRSPTDGVPYVLHLLQVDGDGRVVHDLDLDAVELLPEGPPIALADGTLGVVDLGAPRTRWVPLGPGLAAGTARPLADAAGVGRFGNALADVTSGRVTIRAADQTLAVLDEVELADHAVCTRSTPGATSSPRRDLAGDETTLVIMCEGGIVARPMTATG